MENQFERTELLLGKDAIQKLKNAHVAVFGVGGVEIGRASCRERV